MTFDKVSGCGGTYEPPGWQYLSLPFITVAIKGDKLYLNSEGRLISKGGLNSSLCLIKSKVLLGTQLKILQINTVLAKIVLYSFILWCSLFIHLIYSFSSSSVKCLFGLSLQKKVFEYTFSFASLLISLTSFVSKLVNRGSFNSEI